MSSPRRARAIRGAVAITLLAIVAVMYVPGAAADTPGDWPMVRYDAGNTGYDSSETTLRPPLTLAWNRFFLGEQLGTPVVSGSVLYVEHGINSLSAIDAATGAVKWRSTVGEGPLSSTLAVANGFVFVGSRDNNLYALHIDTGSISWSYRTFGNLESSSPVVVNGVVYVTSLFRTSSHYAEVYALDSATGALRWSYSFEASWPGKVTSPAVADGVVYVISKHGYLEDQVYALDAQTGQLKWTFSPGVNLYPDSPVAASGAVYSWGDNTLYAVDSQTGQLKWTAPGNSGMRVAVADGVVYLASSFIYCTYPKLYALDASTGTAKWEQDGLCINGTLIGANGVLYGSAPSNSYSTVLAFDAQTGRRTWSFSPARRISDTCSLGCSSLLAPVIANGTMYVSRYARTDLEGTVGGMLYALQNGVSVPDLSVANIATRDTVYPGDTLTYTVSLDKTSDNNISVAITDTIPAGTSLITDNLSAGAVYSPTIRSVLWSGTTPPSGSVVPSPVITFEVTVGSTITSGYLSNTVAVSDGTLTTTSTISTPVLRRSFMPLLLRDHTGGW